MSNFLDKFKLHAEKEHLPTVIENISNGSVFRGTNLWILMFAIFVASLGLNVNSTAVIIGAMLISPLMGPIMAIGLGVGINDAALLRKAMYNFLIATGVALTTSTIFFLMSPLNEAHSEILARTSPTIYDVLIALFGGFAGIIATSSKQKGNVIPGVAIATALMPPLCTAGYGLATLQFGFFFGAFYLFIINTVFIALATFVLVRFLHFPYKKGLDEKAEKRAHRIVWTVVIITLVPSLYFGYDLVEQDKFTKKANSFINNEAHFTNDYLLSKKIDAKNNKISLVYGGKEITAAEIDALKSQLKKYDMPDASLEVKQGFAYLVDEQNKLEDGQQGQLTMALQLKEIETKTLQQKLDSVSNMQKLSNQVYAELRAQYPGIKTAILQPSVLYADSTTYRQAYVVVLSSRPKISLKEKTKIVNWLRVRLNRNDIELILSD